MVERAHRYPRAAWSAGLVLGLGACSTDTSGLELRQPGSAGATVTESDGTGGRPPATQEPARPIDPIDAPPGDEPARVTLLDGVVDGGELWACRSASAAELPWPESGIAYAASAAFSADWDVSAEDVELRLFVGGGAEVAGLDCAALDAAAARNREASVTDGGAGDDAGTVDGVEPLAVRHAGRVHLPAGTLERSRHYVLAVAGCAATRSDSAPNACGPDDPLSGEPLSLALVALGAQTLEDDELMTLQFLNASRAVGAVDVVLQGTSEHDVSVMLAASASFGALVPRQPSTVRAPIGVELRAAQTSTAELVQAWSDVTVDGTAPAELGKGYVLAYVGPSPSVSATLGFARPRFVLIESP